MEFLQANQQCQNTEMSTKQWHQSGKISGPYLIMIHQLTPEVDWIKVLRLTRHNSGHFGDVLPSQSFGIVLKKLNLLQPRMWANAQRDGHSA